MHKVTLPITALTFLTFGAALAIAYSSDPPESFSGAPGEGTCIDCHDSYALNQGGMVELVDAPALYRAGSTYRIKVRLTTSNTAGDAGRQWGFELTAINTSDGTGTGTFANVAGEGTSIGSGNGPNSSRRYVRHATSHADESSPVEWLVDWTAPAGGSIPVMFYLAGVAGDAAQGSSGDWAYANSWSAADTTTDVRASTWGGLKARYRK